MLAPSEYEADAVRGYLDTATYGLPPRSVLRAVEDALHGWQTRMDWQRWEADGEVCRTLFAEIVGAAASEIAITTSVSAAAGSIAASLPAREGDNVVVHADDFTSALFPWTPLERRGVEFRALPLDRLADGIDERTALIALSAVQSADGRVADLAPLRNSGARLFVDATHAVGAIPVGVEGVDYLACSAYKWIPAPRGLSFLYVRPERLDEVAPWVAGWKSRREWNTRYYGLPPDLWDDARRLDTSLPWFSAAGARPALELIRAVGVERIAEHDLDLARRFARELGVGEPGAPIVTLSIDDPAEAVERLEARGVKLSVRAGAVRASFHLYNDQTDVDLALEALAPLTAGKAESAT